MKTNARFISLDANARCRLRELSERLCYPS